MRRYPESDLNCFVLHDSLVADGVVLFSMASRSRLYQEEILVAEVPGIKCSVRYAHQCPESILFSTGWWFH